MELLRGKPHVAQCLDAFVDVRPNGKHRTALVFERFGTSTNHLLGKMEVPAIRAISLGVSSALAWLHAHNMLHCDVKPANILIKVGPRPLAILSDFGSVLQVESAHCSAGFRCVPDGLLACPCWVPCAF